MKSQRSPSLRRYPGEVLRRSIPIARLEGVRRDEALVWKLSPRPAPSPSSRCSTPISGRTARRRDPRDQSFPPRRMVACRDRRRRARLRPPPPPPAQDAGGRRPRFPPRPARGDRDARRRRPAPRGWAHRRGEGVAPSRWSRCVRATPAHLVRLAWHLGNRHLPVQVEADRLLIREDHVIEAMLRGLGATVDPRRGALRSRRRRLWPRPCHGVTPSDDGGHDHDMVTASDRREGRRRWTGGLRGRSKAAARHRSLQRLLAWLSPAFPVGGFSYSHGLEWAIEDGTVNDRAST